VREMLSTLVTEYHEI